MNNNQLLKLATIFHLQCLAKFDKLDKKYLNDLPTARDKEIYLSSLFKESGIGGSRITYIISPKKVLKLILDDDSRTAIEQNYNEAMILNKYHSSLLPKLYDVAPDYTWIEVELVRPLSNAQEIEQLTGIPGNDFIFLMENNASIPGIINWLNTSESGYTGANLHEEIKKWQEYKNHPFIIEVLKLIHDTNIDPWELSLPFNLGKSAAGHLVLLDVGKRF